MCVTLNFQFLKFLFAQTRNIKYCTIKTEFSFTDILDEENNGPVIVPFIGMSIKAFKDEYKTFEIIYIYIYIYNSLTNLFNFYSLICY